jgi:ADP-ribose pyrophosphatase
VYEGRLLGLTVERWGENEREIVEHPGAVAIVAVDAEGYVTLVRQLREATRKRLLEIPAGTAEPGEQPLETAKRELQEECGLTGGEWRELAAFWTTPGFCRERMHVFAAEGVERGEASPAEDEELELVRWPVAEIGQPLAGSPAMLPAQAPLGIVIVLRALVFRSTRSTTLPAAAHMEPKATTA